MKEYTICEECEGRGTMKVLLGTIVERLRLVSHRCAKCNGKGVVEVKE